MRNAYQALMKSVNRTGFGPQAHELIRNLFHRSHSVLKKCERLELISKVSQKTYFSFVANDGKSRPVNVELFLDSPDTAFGCFEKILLGERRSLSPTEITRSVYSVAMTCCAAVDVTSKSDRKTQGTIFEWLCASLIQAALGVIPARSLPVLNLDLKGNLPTDFVFDLGIEKPKFHLPVKTSTRERIIQVWAHQRVLDGVYGVGRFLAMPIVLTETKLDSKKLEVVEICLPWQWRLYQMHIADLWNVFYLDVPSAYLELDSKFPRIGVATLGDALAHGGRLDELLETHNLLD